MAMLKCKMCGGELDLTAGASTAQCEYCGSMQTVPKADNEKKLALFSRANRLRAACEFDKAAGLYETIVAEFPEEAEAYWGLVLCKYGIEYVDDPATGKKIPTCHRSGFDSVMKDANVELAQEYADVVARRLYREEAKQIEQLRKDIIAVSANEEPYDVFICYKETDFGGKRTLDSVLAQDIYDALTEKDYRVFFSRISLEDKLGTEYEPYIFAALNSAKIMLVVGTDFEYFNAVWVKNEWGRFLKLMAQDKAKHLIPCFKGIDAYDMPEEFARLQAQDLDKMGAIQDIVRGVQKLLPKHLETGKDRQIAAQNNPTAEAYLKRATMALEDREWSEANGFCEQVLNLDPENADAYLIKLLAEMRVSALAQLTNAEAFSEDNGNYKKLLRFADETLKATLANCLARVKQNAKERAEEAQKRAKHDAAEAEFKKNATIENGVLVKYRGKETDVYIPYCVTSIGTEAFSGKRAITTVTIPDSVTSIGEDAFSWCEALKTITIPDSVTDIEKGAFRRCDALASVTIPGSVKKIGEDAFWWCKNLASITLGEGITHIGKGAFGVCKALTAISIPNSVTSIGGSAFCDCEGLAAISIPNSVTRIGDSAFHGCEALTSVTIPASVTQIGKNPFSSCAEGLQIRVAEGNENYAVINGHLVDMKMGTLIFGDPVNPIPNDGRVTAIGDSAFFDCATLADITIPDGVTRIGDRAFCGCESLTSITIPASVTQIGTNPFESCSEELQIRVALGNENCVVIDGHLVDTKTGTLITGNPERPIPADGSVTIIGEIAFSGGESITEIMIPNGVTAIEKEAFSWCESITSLTIPGSVNSIGEKAFSWCKALASVTIENGVARICERAFQFCEKLTAVTIPDSVTFIDKDAFEWCEDVTIFAPPESYAWKWAEKIGKKVQEDETTKQARLAAERAEQEEKERVARVKHEEEMRQRREAGLCQHCGGQLKGMFSKKCASCGKPKDY